MKYTATKILTYIFILVTILSLAGCAKNTYQDAAGDMTAEIITHLWANEMIKEKYLNGNEVKPQPTKALIGKQAEEMMNVNFINSSTIKYIWLNLDARIGNSNNYVGIVQFEESINSDDGIYVAGALNIAEYPELFKTSVYKVYYNGKYALVMNSDDELYIKDMIEVFENITSKELN